MTAGGAPVPMPFSEFQRRALYGDAGFYSGAVGGRAGRRGSFITAPEVGPLFGAVIGNYLDEQWHALGEPSTFTVVDAGAGPGTLARTVLHARPACRAALRYVAVEISAAQRADHPAEVESRADLPREPFDGVIIANELLDNLPIRLAVYDAGWREAYVIVNADGSYAETLSGRFDPVPAVLPARAAHGARAPLHDEAVAWLDQARRLLRRGSVLALDYVRPRTAELAARPWREWLRTYRDHERGGHYLHAPGTQDITCDVALDQFPEPDTLRTQAQFLRRYGIDELVAEARRALADGTAGAGLAGLRLRSRISESEALLDPDGLGAFTVVEWRAD